MGAVKPTVLVTRPKGREQQLMEALQDAGYKSVHFPVLEISPVTEGDTLFQTVKARVLDLDLYQHIIFVSMNAVACGMYYFDAYWPQLPVQQLYYAIGDATAKTLASYDIMVTASGIAAMNSEELLQTETLQNITGHKVLIVRGVGGRDYLHDNLTARGAQVDFMECYRRDLPQQEQGKLQAFINEQQINIICANSGESLTNLCALYGETLSGLQSLPIVVPGERVAKLAEQKGFTRVLCAENAGTHATLKALQCHYN